MVGLGRIFETINRAVIRSIIGLAVLMRPTGEISLSVAIAATGGAVATSVLTGRKPIPGTIGGIDSGQQSFSTAFLWHF